MSQTRVAAREVLTRNADGVRPVSMRSAPRVLLLAATLSLLGCWATPGNTGWRCTTKEECSEGLSCLTYIPPKGSQVVHLCSKPGDRMTSKTPYGWPVIVGFWVVILGLPGGLAFSIHRDRRALREQASKAGPS